jgi:hypothetical protein
MGVSPNPLAYMPPNVSNVIEGDSDSDVSPPNAVDLPMTPTRLESVCTLTASEILAPLSVPHLFWNCTISGPVGTLPISFSALIDYGSHLVLISDKFIKSLQLHRPTLAEPLEVEMAMPESGLKNVVQLRDWVKLSLYDQVGSWTSKTVRAVIAPSLCAPVILGLPFLQHNKIVIDHDARTAIDKESGFDLLNPTPPPPPKPIKRKLKQFFLDLKADHCDSVSRFLPLEFPVQTNTDRQS